MKLRPQERALHCGQQNPLQLVEWKGICSEHEFTAGFPGGLGNAQMPERQGQAQEEAQPHQGRFQGKPCCHGSPPLTPDLGRSLAHSGLNWLPMNPIPAPIAQSPPCESCEDAPAWQSLGPMQSSGSGEAGLGGGAF